ncbi:MAG: rhomboid family intramembrane serine protease [Alloprevotella sp.]|nr:rhomboid family intramembrane serine protease [Alloprevotella sp.]
MANNFLRQTPPATLNLIVINCIVLLAQYVARQAWGLDLAGLLGLHFVLASGFRVWQLVTYLFLHGDAAHLFFNMFALWMFGVVIERTLGQRRFLAYYFVCGVGAGLCQELWQLGQYLAEGLGQYGAVRAGDALLPMDAYLNLWTTVGASGACYGVLLAFGVLYPEQRIMLLIPPIPMRAKYFVFAYAVIELVSAFASNGNIAHFAHLGGMLFGWLLLRHWRRAARRGGADPRGEGPTILQRIRNLFPQYREGREGTERPSMGGREPDYEYNLRKKRQEERLDEILDKVRQSGYDSLTAEEKRELFQYGQG